MKKSRKRKIFSFHIQYNYAKFSFSESLNTPSIHVKFSQKWTKTQIGTFYQW